MRRAGSTRRRDGQVVFGAFAVLAASMLIPVFEPIAWLLVSAVVILSVVTVVSLARARR